MRGAGSLVVVGTGYQPATHTTPEALFHIQRADKLFYLVDPVTALWLETVNSSAESLEDSYATGKDRRESYDEMVLRVLKPVRRNLNVCMALYGHPGVFVDPSHEAVRRARSEGFEATNAAGDFCRGLPVRRPGHRPCERMSEFWGDGLPAPEARNRYVQPSGSLADRRNRCPDAQEETRKLEPPWLERLERSAGAAVWSGPRSSHLRSRKIFVGQAGNSKRASCLSVESGGNHGIDALCSTHCIKRWKTMTSASLTVVGTGLKFGTQLTPQAHEVIRRCDRLFYLVYDPVSARWLDELKPSAVSLHRFYRPKKHWRDCCDKMVEAIMGDLRIDLNVCAAFGGHPALCVYPSHEAMRRARQEGFATTM